MGKVNTLSANKKTASMMRQSTNQIQTFYSVKDYAPEYLCFIIPGLESKKSNTDFERIYFGTFVFAEQGSK